MTLVSKSFSEIVTFSRSSNATRVGPTGLVEYAPHNLLTYSQEFDNAAWTKSNVTATANTAAAPDGSITADSIIEDTANNFHIVNQSFPFVSGTTYTFSIFVKANGRNFARCLFGNTAFPNNKSAVFDLSNNSIANSDGVTATITSAGNGWYRISASLTADATATESVYWGPANALNADYSTYTGDGTSGIYAWGAQLSVGAVPGDYTPTTSAAVYGPRFDYDPVTLAARGLLVEEQSTNLCTYSEQINQWSATSYNVNITSNTVTAPDGQVTAETVASDTTNSYHIIGPADVGFTSGSTYTFSIFVKAGTARYVQILFGSAAFPLTEYANFDLQTGTVVGGDTADATISALANGWYRVAYNGTANVSVADRAYLGIITTASAARAEAYTQVLSIYAWGAQLE